MEELLERRPVWIGQYEESISIEALRTRESYEESTDDLFLDHLGQEEPADKLSYRS